MIEKLDDATKMALVYNTFLQNRISFSHKIQLSVQSSETCYGPKFTNN